MLSEEYVFLIEKQSVCNATERCGGKANKYLTLTYLVPVGFDLKNYFRFTREYVIDMKTGRADLSQIYPLNAEIDGNSLEPVLRIDMVRLVHGEEKPLERFVIQRDGRQIFLTRQQLGSAMDGQPFFFIDRGIIEKADPRSLDMEHALIDSMPVCQRIQQDEFTRSQQALLSALSQVVNTIQVEVEDESREGRE